jgi:hypothetical protein
MTYRPTNEEELLDWKTTRIKSPKNIHRQNRRQKSTFTPAESEQFQIGTRICERRRLLSMMGFTGRLRSI